MLQGSSCRSAFFRVETAATLWRCIRRLRSIAYGSDAVLLIAQLCALIFDHVEKEVQVNHLICMHRSPSRQSCSPRSLQRDAPSLEWWSHLLISSLTLHLPPSRLSLCVPCCSMHSFHYELFAFLYLLLQHPTMQYQRSNKTCFC